MNQHIAKIFIVIIIVGILAYLVNELPNFIGSVSETVSSNNFIKINTARNSDYFKNLFESVNNEYYGE